MNDLLKKTIVFQSDRYEEWQMGQCISQGPIGATVTIAARSDGMHFEISDAPQIRIIKSFDFSFEGAAILPDRIQLVNPDASEDPTAPVVCHLFLHDGKIEYVRFAMTSPDRLVEFYGCVVDSRRSWEDFLF